MAPSSSKTPRGRGPTADAATLAAHSTVLADAGKPVKQRLAALAALGWSITDEPQRLAAVLKLLTDPSEPIQLRLAALAVLQSATFHPERFERIRADYLKALRKVSSDDDLELRQRALGMLAREHDPATQEKLIEGLREPAKALVAPEKALQLLGYDLHSDAYPIARAIVEAPPNEMARREALRLLAADGASAQLFENILMDKGESCEIRQLSASALHNLAPERLQACARQITMDSSEPSDIRSVGVTALTHFGDDDTMRQDDVLNAYLKQLGDGPEGEDPGLQSAARQYVTKRLA